MQRFGGRECSGRKKKRRRAAGVGEITRTAAFQVFFRSSSPSRSDAVSCEGHVDMMDLRPKNGSVPRWPAVDSRRLRDPSEVMKVFIRFRRDREILRGRHGYRAHIFYVSHSAAVSRSISCSGNIPLCRVLSRRLPNAARPK